MTSGEEIRAKLAELHRGQEWLAGQMGVTRTAVSRWITGARRPHWTQLLRLEKVLGMEFEELKDVRESRPPQPSPPASASASAVTGIGPLDWFAGMAMQPLIAKIGREKAEITADDRRKIALDAYLIARAMSDEAEGLQ